MRGIAVVLALVLGSTSGCRSLPEPDDQSAIRTTLDELYDAFCFDAGGMPDWEAQRRVYLPGASFVAPIRPDRDPVAVDTEAFLRDFEAFAGSEPYRTTGFHERIVGVRIDAFGGVAHAYVAFEGFVPGDGRAATRGLDSIQLVHDGGAWRLASFSTQYETEGLVLPARFLRSSYPTDANGERPAP